MAEDRLEIESLGIVKSHRIIADTHDPDAPLCQRDRTDRSDVSEALNDCRCGLRIDPELLHRPACKMRDTVASGIPPAVRPAGRDRLAGHDLGYGPALVHGIGVHEPGHHLLVRTEIWSHHVRVGADERDHLLHVATGQSFQFAPGQRAGIHRDATLRAALGQAR